MVKWAFTNEQTLIKSLFFGLSKMESCSHTPDLDLVPSQSCTENQNEDIVIISGDTGWTCCSCSLDFGLNVSPRKHLDEYHKANTMTPEASELSSSELCSLEVEEGNSIGDGKTFDDNHGSLLLSFEKETIQIVRNDWSPGSPSMPDEVGEDSDCSMQSGRERRMVEVKTEKLEAEENTTMAGDILEGTADDPSIEQPNESSFCLTQSPRPVALRVNENCCVEMDSEGSDTDDQEKGKNQYKLFDLIGRAAGYFKDVNSREALILLVTSLATLEFKNSRYKEQANKRAQSVVSVALTYEKKLKRTAVSNKKKVFCCKICSKTMFGYTSEVLLWHCKTHFMRRANVLQCKYCSKTFKYKGPYVCHLAQCSRSNKIGNVQSAATNKEKNSANPGPSNKDMQLGKQISGKRSRGRELLDENDLDDEDHFLIKTSASKSKSNSSKLLLFERPETHNGELYSEEHSYSKTPVNRSRSVILDSTSYAQPLDTRHAGEGFLDGKMSPSVREEARVDISSCKRQPSAKTMASRIKVTGKSSQEARVKCVICGVHIFKRPSLCKRHYRLHFQDTSKCPVCLKKILDPNILCNHVYEHQLQLREPVCKEGALHSTEQVNIATAIFGQDKASHTKAYCPTKVLKSDKLVLSAVTQRNYLEEVAGEKEREYDNETEPVQINQVHPNAPFSGETTKLHRHGKANQKETCHPISVESVRGLLPLKENRGAAAKNLRMVQAVREGEIDRKTLEREMTGGSGKKSATTTHSEEQLWEASPQIIRLPRQIKINKKVSTLTKSTKSAFSEKDDKSVASTSLLLNHAAPDRKNEMKIVRVAARQNEKVLVLEGAKLNDKHIAERVNCVVCGQAFIAADSVLLKHFEVHVYVAKNCPLCSCRIPNKDALKLHILQHQRENASRIGTPSFTIGSEKLASTWDSSKSMTEKLCKISGSGREEESKESESTTKDLSKSSESSTTEQLKGSEQDDLGIQSIGLDSEEYLLETTRPLLETRVQPGQEQSPLGESVSFYMTGLSAAEVQSSEVKVKEFSQKPSKPLKRKLRLSNQKVRCIVCGLIYEIRRSALLAHYTVHVRNRTTCPLCNVDIPQKAKLKEHIYEHQKTRNLSLLLPVSYKQGPVFVPNRKVCVLCGDFFSNHLHDPETHIKMHFLEKNSCMVCDKVFHDEGSFAKHVLDHQGMHETSGTQLNAAGAKADELQLPKSDKIQLSGQEEIKSFPEKESAEREIPFIEIDALNSLVPEKQNQMEVEAGSRTASAVAGNFDNEQLNCVLASSTSDVQLGSQEKELKCGICKMELNSDMTAIEEHSDHHPEKLHVECTACSKKFDSMESPMPHLSIHTKDTWKFACRLCSAAFRSPMECRQHRRACRFVECTDKRPISQNTSDDTPSEVKKRRLAENEAECIVKESGVTETRKEEFIRCTKCSALIFNQPHSIQRHMQVHELETHQCEHCERAFFSKERLEQHTASHSYGGVCEVCGSTFQTKKGLEQHRLLHTGGVGHYPCTRCNKAFLYEVRLKKHMEKHNNLDSIFTCEYCGKTYMNRTPLLHHIAINHENSKESVFLYKCDQCPAMYSFRSELRDHIAFRHKGQTLYTCKFCQKGFNCRPTLMRHERIEHTKFFPHKCDKCEEAFAERVKLVSHQIRVHKSVTPYRCNECGTSCATAGALRHHMKIHDEKRPRPYKCVPCNVAYFDKYHLDRHLKRGKCKQSVYCVVVVEPPNQVVQALHQDHGVAYAAP